MSKNKKPFSRFAIPNLTLFMLCAYLIGYFVQLAKPKLTYFITLDPYLILKGQVWRLVSWIMLPPDSLSLATLIFVVIMLLFTYTIGTTMERTMGTYQYNIYVWSGVLFTILGAFILYGYFCLTYGMEAGPSVFETYMNFGYGLFFNTYYIMLSVFLAFSVFFPDDYVFFMMLIPMKMKWLGIFYLLMMGYEVIVGNAFSRTAILAALFNFAINFLRWKRMSRFKPKEIKRKMEYKQQVKKAVVVSKHKCAICGRTDEENPELEFRFCSKCNGNYEYCQDHLFTHEHVK